MFKPKRCAWLIAAACALPSYAAMSAAMNIQPDPQNAGGYVIAAPDLAAMEKAKTANPMYAIWAKALATRS
ncbi:TPA: carbohydrate-binding protein, partial [Aeromonas veronii]